MKEIVKIGSIIYTCDGTQLIVRGTCENTVYCCEFAYNDTTQDYDILIDDLRILRLSEIENIMHEYDGKNHRCSLEY